MREEHQWLWRKLGEKCVKNLSNHGFDSHLVENADRMMPLFMELVSGYETFGVGGSLTIRQLGLPDRLKEKQKHVVDHWQEGMSEEAQKSARLEQGRCQCFLSSANAISATGEIVNVAERAVHVAVGDDQTSAARTDAGNQLQVLDRGLVQVYHPGVGLEYRPTRRFRFRGCRLRRGNLGFGRRGCRFDRRRGGGRSRRLGFGGHGGG